MREKLNYQNEFDSAITEKPSFLHYEHRLCKCASVYPILLQRSISTASGATKQRKSPQNRQRGRVSSLFLTTMVVRSNLTIKALLCI